MDDEEDKYYDANASCSVEPIYEEHTRTTYYCSEQCGSPVEEMKRRAEVGCGADLEEEARQVCDLPRLVPQLYHSMIDEITKKVIKYVIVTKEAIWLMLHKRVT